MRQFIISFITILLINHFSYTQQQISHSFVNSGGKSLNGTENILIGSVGETFIGSSSNSVYLSSIGFWDIYKQDNLTEVDNEDKTPARFELQQNYPNPFNPSTLINYHLPTSANVEIKVFDVLGKEVETLLSEYKNAGKHEIVFSADRFSSGVYFYSINARGENESFYQIKKMLLIK